DFILFIFLEGVSILSKATVNPSTATWTLTTERIVIAGVLAAITIVLGIVPNIGFIPLPNAIGSATIEHIPTILSGIIAGPVVGVFSGLVFGVVSFFRSTTPLFKDPIVSILPRLFIGLTAWATFLALKRVNRDLAAAVAGVVGSATNTILVVGAIILRGYFPAQLIIPTVLVQSIIEAIIAGILTVILARVFTLLEGRVVRAQDTKPREQLPY
ncbi:MAG TPA: ECF transporter S component, partial [Ktedonobacteraceae bacterium]|nr:ECF transporter S component [Ktedonobacteraceae bacterium]